MYQIPKDPSLTTKPTKPTKPTIPDNSGKLRENLPQDEASLEQPTSSTSTATSSNETSSSITTSTVAMSTIDQMTFNSLIELSDDIIPAHVFPELSVREIINTCSISKTSVGLFSKIPTGVLFKQRIEEKYFTAVTADNSLDKWAVFELFYEHCLKETPPRDEPLPAQRVIATKLFQSLKTKIFSFDPQDPFFLSWGNYFLSMMYFFGYGIDTAFSTPEAAKKAYLAEGKKHLHAAAQHNNPKAMLILARAHNSHIFGFSDLNVFQILEQFGIITRSYGFGKAIEYSDFIDEVPNKSMGAEWFEKAFNLEDPEAIKVAVRYYHTNDRLKSLNVGVKKGDSSCAALLGAQKFMHFAKSHQTFDDETESFTEFRNIFVIVFADLPADSFFSQELVNQVQEIIRWFERAAILGSEEAANFLVNCHAFMDSSYQRELETFSSPNEMREKESPLVKLFTDKTNSLRWCEMLGRLRADAAESMAILYRKGQVLYPTTPKSVTIKTEVNLQKTVEWYKFLLREFLNKSSFKISRTRWFIDLMGLYFDHTLACFDEKKGVACGEKGILWGVSECATYLGGFYFFGGADGTQVDKNKANYYFSMATNQSQNLLLHDIYGKFKNYQSYNFLDGLRETLRWQLIGLRRNLNNRTGDCKALLFDLVNIANTLVNHNFFDGIHIVKLLKLGDRNSEKISNAIIMFETALTNLKQNNNENIYALVLLQVNTFLQELEAQPFDESELQHEEPEETSESIAGISAPSIKF